MASVAARSVHRDRRRAIPLALLIVVTSIGSGPGRAIGAEDAVDGLRLPPDAVLAAAADEPVQAMPPVVEGDVDLGRVLEDTVATFEALPASDWDVESLAFALDYDPMRAFELVRDRIAFEPYRGVLRGPAGTLAARAGNSYDRALLLSSLLDAMGVVSRFAFAELDPRVASMVSARAFDPVAAPFPSAPERARTSVDLGRVEKRARRDYALIVDALGDRLSELRASELDEAHSDARHHAWVQMAMGPEWVDLDPTLASARAGDVLTAAERVADELPAAESHRVGVTVEADVLAGGELRHETLLDESLDAWSASTAETYLMFVPELEGVGGAIAEGLGTAVSYSPRLIVDGEVRRGAPFPVRPERDIFTDETDGARLVRLAVTVSVAVPGREPVRHERIVVDRVPPERAGSPRLLQPEELLTLPEDAAGPLALQPLHHILVSTGGISPWRQTVRQGHAIEFVNRLLQGEADRARYAVTELLLPFAVANEGLVLTSERAIVPSLASGREVAAFVAEPRVFVVSFGLGTGEPTSASGGTDLVHDRVRVLGAEGSEHAAARARLWYGTLQTALETEQLMRVAAFAGEDATVQSVSTLMTGPLTVLAPDAEPGSGLTLAPGIDAAVRAGATVVVPGDPRTSVGWWAIAPDGSARSTGSDGRGWGNWYTPDVTKHGAGTGVNTVDPATGKAVSNKLPGEPVAPSRCPRNEYLLIVVCVSIPGMIVLAGIGILTAVLVLYAVGVIGNPS